MPRTRVIYASQALFVGPSPAQTTNCTTGNTRQIFRTQSASWDFNVVRKDIEQFGQLAAIDQVILQSPTVNLNFSYLATNAYNESGLGFITDGSVSAIAALLNESNDEKNYFILTAPEGQDAVGYAGPTSSETVVGIGNGFVSSYSFEAAVGGLPTASVKVEALNVEVYSDTTGQYIPAVNPATATPITGFTFNLPAPTSGVAGQVSALRPGDITLSLASVPLGVDLSSAKIQRFTLGFDLQRDPQEELGSPFALTREIRFPVKINVSIEANVSELTTGSLSNIICNDVPYDLSIALAKNQCGGGGPVALSFTVLGAKLDGEHFNTTLGPNETVTVNWTALMGSAQQQNIGLFISGVQD